MKENLLLQKSRLRWIKNGDANSRYFHARINSRRRGNNIQALQSDEGWHNEVEDVKKEIFSHFAKQFSETQ